VRKLGQIVGEIYRDCWRLLAAGAIGGVVAFFVLDVMKGDVVRTHRLVILDKKNRPVGSWGMEIDGKGGLTQTLMIGKHDDPRIVLGFFDSPMVECIDGKSNARLAATPEFSYTYLLGPNGNVTSTSDDYARKR